MPTLHQLSDKTRAESEFGANLGPPLCPGGGDAEWSQRPQTTSFGAHLGADRFCRLHGLARHNATHTWTPHGRLAEKSLRAGQPALKPESGGLTSLAMETRKVRYSAYKLAMLES